MIQTSPRSRSHHSTSRPRASSLSHFTFEDHQKKKQNKTKNKTEKRTLSLSLMAIRSIFFGQTTKRHTQSHRFTFAVCLSVCPPTHSSNMNINPFNTHSVVVEMVVVVDVHNPFLSS